MSKEKVKYSPAPWRLIHKKDGYRLDAYVLAPDYSSPGREFQVIDLHDHHPIKEHNERRLADIKLMTAAPELLEALQVMVSEVTGGCIPSIKDAQSAIEKALK